MTWRATTVLVLATMALVACEESDDAPPPPSPVVGMAPPPSDPLRPDIALTLTGGCSSLRFDVPVLRVTSAANLRMVAITALENDALTGSISIQGEGPLDHAVVLGGGPVDGALINLSAGGTNLWNSGLTGASGSVRFLRWQPAAGIAELSFEHVVLPHMSGSPPCTIDGRITTRGVTGN
jgi:hypothetical protein